MIVCGVSNETPQNGFWCLTKLLNLKMKLSFMICRIFKSSFESTYMYVCQIVDDINQNAPRMWPSLLKRRLLLLLSVRKQLWYDVPLSVLTWYRRHSFGEDRGLWTPISFWDRSSFYPFDQRSNYDLTITHLQSFQESLRAGHPFAIQVRTLKFFLSIRCAKRLATKKVIS